MTRVASRSFACVLAMTASLSVTGAAAAQDAPPTPTDAAGRGAAVQKLSDEGAALYKARDFRSANDKFQQAYAIDPDPNLLYNIAKCFEALGDKKTALEKYELFINSPGADSGGRVRAQEAVRLLKGEPSPRTEPARASTPPPRDDRSSLRTAAWVTLGVGAATATVGTVFFVLGTSDHNKITGAANYDKAGQVVALTESRANDLRDSGTTKKTVGGVLWGMGGAALVTSAVLFIMQRGGSAEGNVAFGATPLPGGAAGSIVGRF